MIDRSHAGFRHRLIFITPVIPLWHRVGSRLSAYGSEMIIYFYFKHMVKDMSRSERG
ncbi:hypothetical protein GDI2484 [Gluconacetobacter diazotrophicus PA1 5]|uniref:Uncharacterized protein n=1 Tax=Gluconacetobacter diazotrophicus (strain ATCC 49037 / DSM 5601 / CCUG 37298 / CIP 103539 / LMG 7603 / PAl5) TaxID=272568 RepID=A9HND0_GLUDA|nr:hypothetical protein GDI2484 [Gluconacetobacter diazotrophicus PA1 5]